MYLCICHGLNEKSVAKAHSQGACSAARVFHHYQVKPRCGKCVQAIQSAVSSSAGEERMPTPIAAE